MKQFCLTSNLRLKTAADFKRVFDAGRRMQLRWFGVIYSPNNLNTPRFGVIISKRMAKRAVTRNRIRRVIREFFRNSQHDLPPGDYVFLAKPGIDKIDNITVFQCLTDFATRFRV